MHKNDPLVMIAYILPSLRLGHVRAIEVRGFVAGNMFNLIGILAIFLLAAANAFFVAAQISPVAVSTEWRGSRVTTTYSSTWARWR
jgi:hypothetical protein